jgi:hypothetical protein
LSAKHSEAIDYIGAGNRAVFVYGGVCASLVNNPTPSKFFALTHFFLL